MTTEGIKSYKISELEKQEKLNYRTIKKRYWEYIPIIFENTQSRTKYNRGEQKTPHSIRYVKVTDIEEYMNGKYN